MAAHRGFRLVEAINRVEPGRRIDAITAWPLGSGLAPVAFLLEAVAQAAGWLIAASTGFARRGLPVSIGATRLVADPTPGARVELHAEITSWRDTTAVLRGGAVAGNRLIGEAEGGISGLLAAADLEDPDTTRREYERLIAMGEGNGTPHLAAPPGSPRVEAMDGKAGRATWVLSGGADLFADHFPRLPVLPGSLQVQVLVDLARDVIAAGGDLAGRLAGLRQVRFRRQVRPGERLTVEVEMVERTGGATVLAGRTHVEGERATSIVAIEFEPAG